MIYWFIGQPHSGKTTLANLLREYLAYRKPIYFDGDDLRKIFNESTKPEHYTREWREKQAKALHNLIVYLADQGFDIIIATVNPYRNLREEFKKARKDCKEIYVHKSVNRGREGFNVKDYEVPLENFIDIDTTISTPEQSLKELTDKLGYL